MTTADDCQCAAHFSSASFNDKMDFDRRCFGDERRLRCNNPNRKAFIGFCSEQVLDDCAAFGPSPKRFPSRGDVISLVFSVGTTLAKLEGFQSGKNGKKNPAWAQRPGETWKKMV